jgi:hypothetical protein
MATGQDQKRTHIKAATDGFSDLIELIRTRFFGIEV